MTKSIKNCKTYLYCAIVCVAFSICAASFSLAQAPLSASGEVISYREVTLKPGIKAADFEKWAKTRFNPGMKGIAPGVKAYIARSDRGKLNGGYAYIVIFDTYKTRQAYWPEPNKPTAYFMENFFNPNAYLHEELYEYVDQESMQEYSDWIALE